MSTLFRIVERHAEHYCENMSWIKCDGCGDELGLNDLCYQFDDDDILCEDCFRKSLDEDIIPGLSGSELVDIFRKVINVKCMEATDVS